MRYSRAKRSSVLWESMIKPSQNSDCEDTYEVTIAPTISAQSPHARWEYDKAFVAQSGDICKDGSWVFYEGPDVRTAETTDRGNGDDVSHSSVTGIILQRPLTFIYQIDRKPIHAGRILRVLMPEQVTNTVGTGLVQIERFAVSDEADSRLNMPVLFRDSMKQTLHIVPVSVRKF